MRRLGGSEWVVGCALVAMEAVVLSEVGQVAIAPPKVYRRRSALQAVIWRGVAAAPSRVGDFVAFFQFVVNGALDSGEQGHGGSDPAFGGA